MLWVQSLGLEDPLGIGNPLQYSCLENPQGQKSLVGYSPQGCKELDTTEATQDARRHFLITYSHINKHFIEARKSRGKTSLRRNHSILKQLNNTLLTKLEIQNNHFYTIIVNMISIAYSKHTKLCCMVWFSPFCNPCPFLDNRLWK